MPSARANRVPALFRLKMKNEKCRGYGIRLYFRFFGRKWHRHAVAWLCNACTTERTVVFEEVLALLSSPNDLWEVLIIRSRLFWKTIFSIVQKCRLSTRTPCLLYGGFYLRGFYKYFSPKFSYFASSTFTDCLFFSFPFTSFTLSRNDNITNVIDSIYVKYEYVCVTNNTHYEFSKSNFSSIFIDLLPAKSRESYASESFDVSVEGVISQYQFVYARSWQLISYYVSAGTIRCARTHPLFHPRASFRRNTRRRQRRGDYN